MRLGQHHDVAEDPDPHPPALDVLPEPHAPVLPDTTDTGKMRLNARELAPGTWTRQHGRRSIPDDAARSTTYSTGRPHRHRSSVTASTSAP